MTRRLVPFLAALLMGCSEPALLETTPLDVPNETTAVEFGPLEVDLDLLDGSIFDATTEEIDDKYDGSSRLLAELLVPPSAIDGEYSLTHLTIADTVGTGRVDGRWFEPFVRRLECAVRLESAPIPTAVASYALGATDSPYDGDQFEFLESLTDGSLSVGVTLELFDNSTQRDAYAVQLVEFDRQLADLDCSIDFDNEFDSPIGDVGSLFSLLVPESSEVDIFDIGYPGRGQKSAGLQGNGVGYRYLIGDTVLLTIGITSGIGRPDTEIDPNLVLPVLEAQVERLQAAGLG